MAKPKLATTSLAGCFGCHMSILDIDERILELVELIDFDKSPVDDIKEFTGPTSVISQSAGEPPVVSRSSTQKATSWRGVPRSSKVR